MFTLLIKRLTCRGRGELHQSEMNMMWCKVKPPQKLKLRSFRFVQSPDRIFNSPRVLPHAEIRVTYYQPDIQIGQFRMRRLASISGPNEKND